MNHVDDAAKVFSIGLQGTNGKRKMRIYLTPAETELVRTAIDAWIWKMEKENESVSMKPSGGHWFAGKYCRTQLLELRKKFNDPGRKSQSERQGNS